MAVAANESAVQTPAPPGQSAWIVSGLFDLAFIANLGWLLVWIPALYGDAGESRLQFWQVYFLTTPHRWLTLLLVALDRDRRSSRTPWFAGLALLSAGAVWGAWQYTGALTCLLLVDYVWNGWHFASQHAGVLRMYSRKAGTGHARLEKYCLRGFVFYTVLRLAGWTTGWMEGRPAWTSALDWADIAALCLPAVLLAIAVAERSSRARGRLVYLASVSGLYASLILAVRAHWTVAVAWLIVASALFHAVEYLAIVTHYADRRRSLGSAGAFQQISRYWISLLLAYILCLGLMGTIADRHLRELWLALNLWAAFLHYAYDGMIWKLREPATAAALGVEQPGTHRPSDLTTIP